MKRWNLLVIALSIILFSCRESETMNTIQEYDGPMYELSDVETLYSEEKNENTAFTRFKLLADKQLIFENEDMEFPEGIYIENFNPDGTVKFTIRANKGYYIKEDNVYKAEGNVVLRNLKEDQKLSSEELFWEPGAGEESIYTDKFVIVETKGEKIYGEGLRANPDDLANYKILKPTGYITVDEY
ncbi:MAG: LPS export ABC transporter periplasmic protein LptC [Candidatus Cyclobacteriaceae bacterium M3_2C_046]